MDNRLNLIVSFLGVDKLSGSLKSIIGLGQTGKNRLRELMAEQTRLNREVADYDRKMKGASGSVTALWNAQKKLLVQQEELGAQVARQKRLMAIDARTASLSATGSRMVGEGMSTLMMGGLLAAPIAAAAAQSAHLSGEVDALTNRLRVLGLNEGAVAYLRRYADAMDVAGSSSAENMRYIVEAQGAFRESGAHTLAEQISGARLMAPMMAKLNVTSRALGMEMGEEQERYFLRFIEQAGGLASPKRAAELTDGLFRALQSSGGTVQASNYQGFMAHARSAGMRLSERSLFADFEPLIAELHDSAGTGLMGAWSKMNGLIKNKNTMHEAIRLGLWDKSKVSLDSDGSMKLVKGQNPLNAKAADMLARDPVEFYRQFVLPAYAKNNVTDHTRENVILFGNTGGGLFNQIEKAMPSILHSRQAFERSKSLDKAYEGTKDSYFGAQGQMSAAWKNFLITAGSKGGLLSGITHGLQLATTALRMFTALANKHPTLFKWIGGTVISLVGMKLALAAGKIAFGGLLGPIAKLWGWFSKLKELGSIAAAFPKMAKAFGILRSAAGLLGSGLRLLASGLLRVGMMMLANPMVVVIGAIVVAVGLLAFYVYTHWDKIKAAFSAGWAYLTAKWTQFKGWISGIGHGLMDGLMNALDPKRFADRLLAVARGGITAFKNFFGIKSPSRLMMEMGGHLATGLAIGVDRSGHQPRRAIGRLAAGMAGAMVAAAPAGASGPARTSAITIHIHQQPGEDGEALARRVARIIDQQQRGHRLASYADDF